MRLRPSAVAGSFYPADPAVLAGDVQSLLAAATTHNAAPFADRLPKALICPHAGYVYSGPTAARAYALLAGRKDAPRRIILLGPTHRVPVRGMAVPTVDAFHTPLGNVPIDRVAREAALALPDVVADDAPHAREHSLEVQLPFLQSVLGEFTLLPVAVGNASPEAVCRLIEALYGGPETLILVSSDLSHFHPYATAQGIDNESIAAILELAPRLAHHQACGATPVNGLLLAARRRGLSPHLIDLCNSGDTAGDKQRVVGYAAVGFMEHGAPAELAQAPAASSADALGDALLGLARNAIVTRLGGAPAIFSQVVTGRNPRGIDALDQPGATFVTLTKNGNLRGCIGSLQAHRPLRDDVSANAQAAAFRDPRFPPVTAAELPQIRVEVSLLSAPEALPVADEADLLRQLRPGVDGVVFHAGAHRATFLPQVWEQLPTPAVFIARLKEKAGLPANYWADDVRIERYGVQKWKQR